MVMVAHIVKVLSATELYTEKCENGEFYVMYILSPFFKIVLNEVCKKIYSKRY